MIFILAINFVFSLPVDAFVIFSIFLFQPNDVIAYNLWLRLACVLGFLWTVITGLLGIYGSTQFFPIPPEPYLYLIAPSVATIFSASSVSAYALYLDSKQPQQVHL